MRAASLEVGVYDAERVDLAFIRAADVGAAGRDQDGTKLFTAFGRELLGVAQTFWRQRVVVKEVGARDDRSCEATATDFIHADEDQCRRRHGRA